MNRRFWSVKRVIGVVGSVLVSGGGGGVMGQVCSYEVVATITGPECSPGEFGNFFGRAIDGQGNVVGSNSCVATPRAALWMFGAPMALALSPPPSTTVPSIAFDLVDPDHIVGRVLPIGQPVGREVATYWLNGSGMLLMLPLGSNSSYAEGINGASLIAGGSNNDLVLNQLRANLWQAGSVQVLELPLGPNAQALDVNDNGQVTGWMGDGDTTTSNAFIWQDGVVTDLGKIPGGTTALGKAINNAGHVAGWGRVPDGIATSGNPHALYWDGEQMIDLGTLPGRKESLAYDINDLDQIVGTATETGLSTLGFLWENGVLYDINDRVVTDLGGLRVSVPLAINNDGWIVASTSAGERVLLAPVGSAPGDVDNNCIVNVEDLILLLGEWGETNSFADTNDDGIVNVLDLLQVLWDWG